METVKVNISLTKNFSSLAAALQEIHEMQDSLNQIDYDASFEIEKPACSDCGNP